MQSQGEHLKAFGSIWLRVAEAEALEHKLMANPIVVDHFDFVRAEWPPCFAVTNSGENFKEPRIRRIRKHVTKRWGFNDIPARVSVIEIVRQAMGMFADNTEQRVRSRI